jgi:RHS repeat-associated protein
VFGGVESGGTQERKLYTGHEQDDTGQTYMKARYYKANIGQFISPDSVIQDEYTPQNLNRFSYVLNNPLKYTDPTGNYYWWLQPAIDKVFEWVGQSLLPSIARRIGIELSDTLFQEDNSKFKRPESTSEGCQIPQMCRKERIPSVLPFDSTTAVFKNNNLQVQKENAGTSKNVKQDKASKTTLSSIGRYAGTNSDVRKALSGPKVSAKGKYHAVK